VFDLVARNPAEGNGRCLTELNKAVFIAARVFHDHKGILEVYVIFPAPLPEKRKAFGLIFNFYMQPAFCATDI
jgi:hypothetical protein